MHIKSDAEIKVLIGVTLKRCIWILIGGVSLLLVFLYVDLFASATNGDAYYWFQRSGALAVIFAAWSEYLLITIHSDVNPSHASGPIFEEFHDMYGYKYKIISVVTIALAIAGTLIWAYGDLIVSS